MWTGLVRKAEIHLVCERGVRVDILGYVKWYLGLLGEFLGKKRHSLSIREEKESGWFGGENLSEEHVGVGAKGTTLSYLKPINGVCRYGEVLVY